MAYQYKVAGETVTLKVDPAVVAVKFADVPTSEKAGALEANGIGPFAQGLDLVIGGLSIIPAVRTWNAAPDPDHGQALEALRGEDAVLDAQPVFRIGSVQVVATGRVVLGVDPEQPVDALLERFGLTAVSRDEERVIADIPAGHDVFDVVAAIEEAPGVRYAEPEFVAVGQHLPSRADAGSPLIPAPLAATQYAMQITRAEQAWAIQPGDPAVRIAIIDEGVDIQHPDLKAQVVGSFDAVDNDSYQQPNPWDGHGTACAGLAAANGAQPGGVRGSGRGCSILAIRIAYADHVNGPWQTTQDWVARAIDWASANGASVLSNSWQFPPSNPIRVALENARVKGRGGRGCVIVAAAGNDYGTAVTFPARLSTVLAVGASNEYDEAKTLDSADHETFWGSSYGPEVDVAAPGVHNLTTDIVGSGGYAAGSYHATFNGTSAATPIVAGACGLILSKRPDLTEAQVRAIITGTADKVGQFAYVGGRNDHMGAGRLNVLAAVQAA